MARSLHTQIILKQFNYKLIISSRTYVSIFPKWMAKKFICSNCSNIFMLSHMSNTNENSKTVLVSSPIQYKQFERKDTG